jgi:rare lipoprotein A
MSGLGGRERALRWSLVVAVLVAACAQLPEQASTPPPAAPAAPTPEPPSTPAPTEPRPPAPPAAKPAQPSADSAKPAGTQRGRVSHYGDDFAGRKTASGAVFDPNGLTMAHRTLPFGTRVRVTNLENRKSVEVVVNDRGPAIADRIADLSLGAARKLGMVDDGVVDALIEVLSLGGS